MPAPGGAPSMGGMSPPGGELSEQLAQMMGGSQGNIKNSNSSSSGTTGGIPAMSGIPGFGSTTQGGSSARGKMGSGNLSPAQMQAAQQAAGAQQVQPREVTSITQEFKRGVSDIFQGIKEFFNLNTWLGINPSKLDPQQQAKAKQVHSRYQQLDQEQQAVARQMFEAKMQKKRMEQEEEQRKKQMEAQKQAQSFEMPSGPKKGPVGPASGKSKKQNVLTKLKQDRTTLNNTRGE